MSKRQRHNQANAAPPIRVGTASLALRRAALLMLYTFVAAQALTVLHFYSVPHRLDLGSTVAEHTRHDCSDQPSDDSEEPKRAPSQKDCQVFALMHLAARPSIAVPIPAPVLVELPALPQAAAFIDCLPSQRERYRLAPSLSPPSA
ncbi:MAG: hypothetical protein RBU37_17710 [Myxococcota bacterium]|jgi:hypothetical protein|nr:hypothetical protein [Myxococcota bacterium]